MLKGYAVQVKIPYVSGCMFARDLHIFGFFGCKKAQALVSAIVHEHNMQVISANLTLPSSETVHIYINAYTYTYGHMHRSVNTHMHKHIHNR